MDFQTRSYKSVSTPARLLTIRVKHSGHESDRWRLIGILLRELYQKLKCPCEDKDKDPIRQNRAVAKNTDRKKKKGMDGEMAAAKEGRNP